MLKLLASSVLTWFNVWGQSQPELKPLASFPWHNSPVFHLPETKQDLITNNIIQSYLQDLTRQNAESDRQGIWIQSGWDTLASNQGESLLPAASLTKIATTLAALNKWGVNHQFDTNLYIRGEIKNGAVLGDLIVEGNGDPLFVWEEAIALGNALSQLGITSIEGNLLVTDKFYMNYQDNSLRSGELLKQGLNRGVWRQETTKQYLQMPVGTPQPEIAIAGKVKLASRIPSDAKPIVIHESLPLGEILRQMNIYSNNKMAQILADLLGGASEIADSSANIADFPSAEISLINGSGLGEENRISPRAVCQMLMAIDKLLQHDSLSAIDLFPTAGRDRVGTVQNRGLPKGAAVKTGTLDNVSALAGVVSTSDRGNIYFSIINYGRQYEYFRRQQDWLINQLVGQWKLTPYNFDLMQPDKWFLGDSDRNIMVVN